MTTTQRIFHHLRTDLHRNWQLLALLAAGLIAFAAIDLMRHLGEPQRFNSPLLMMAVFGFGCLMAFIIIHGDPATGTTPFWKSRPIRGMELFCSKAIQILLVGLLMFAAWIAPPLISGSPQLMAWGFGQTLVPLLFGIAAIAAVSRNLVQALLVGGGIWVGVVAVAWIWNLTGQLPVFGKTEAMQVSGLLLAALLAAAGSLAVVGYQYLRQRQWIAIVILSVVVVAGFLFMQTNTVDLVTRYLTPEEQAVLGVDKARITLNTEPSELQQGSHILHTPSKVYEYVALSAESTFEGLPADVFATRTVVSGEMKDPESGRVILSLSGDSHTRNSRNIAASIDGDVEILWDVMGTPEIVHMTPFLKIPKNKYPSMVGKTWQCQGTATTQLARLIPLQGVPLGKEGAFHQDGWSVIVSSTIDGPSSLRVEFEASTWRTGFHRDRPIHTVLIVNHERNEALATRSIGGGGGNSNRRWHTDSHTTFHRNFWRDGERIEIGDDWLENAEVVVFIEEILGSIRRPISIDALELPEVTWD